LIYIFLFLLIALFNLGAVLFLILVLDSLVLGHDLPTSRKAAKALVKLIKQYKPDAKIFYDLGCGRGTLTLRIKRELPSLLVYGVDNNPVRILFAALKSKILRQKIYFKKQNIFQTDLGEINIVYAYLWYDLMPLLEEKLQRELKEGSIVITNTSNFPNWKPKEIYIVHPKKPDFEKLFVYIKKDQGLKDI